MVVETVLHYNDDHYNNMDFYETSAWLINTHKICYRDQEEFSNTKHALSGTKYAC